MTNYPPGMTLRPIERWPHEFTSKRQRSPFSATLGTTLAQLDIELRHLVEHGGRERRHITHLVCENPQPLCDPIPCRGALGLWTPPADIAAEIHDAIADDDDDYRECASCREPEAADA